MSPCSRLGVLPQPLQPLPASSFLEDLAWMLHLCPPAQIPSGEQGTVTGSHVTAEEAGSVPGLPLLPSNKTILEAGDGLWWVGGYLPAPRAPLEEPARGLAGRQGWAVAFWCFLCSRRCATCQMDLVLQHHRSSPGTLRTASRSVLRVGPNDANSSVLGPSAGVLGTTSPGSSGVISSLAKRRGWTQRSFYLCRKRGVYQQKGS